VDDVMMKFVKALVLAVVLMSTFGVNDANASDSVKSNVGDGKEYAYQITHIFGNEVHGKPLNRISKTNGGIFLYKEEIGFDVKVGDKIVVMWGAEEDIFELIDKAVKLPNGEYVSETHVKITKILNKLRKKWRL